MALSQRIEKQNIEDIFALTPMQEGMLFHYLKDRENDHYSEQLCIDLSGEIDDNYFEQAWKSVIETNEILRTVFRWEGVQQPVQMVLKGGPFYFKYDDLSSRESNEKKEDLLKKIEKDRKKKFDLHDIAFRVTLFKINERKYKLLISNHHILYDGWSNGIILKELLEAYDRLVHHRRPIKESKNKFKAFVRWIQNQENLHQEKYWQEYLKGVDTPTVLSLKKQTTIDTKTTGHYQIELNPNMKTKLDTFAREHQLTLASLFYCSWGILLQRYNSTPDVVFGTTASGRSAKIKDIEKIVGLFINTVPLRIRFPGNQTILNLLLKTNMDLRERIPFEHTSLANINSRINNNNHNELFDTVIIVENYPINIPQAKNNITFENYQIIENTHYTISVIVKLFDIYEINFSYDEGLLDEGTIVQISQHFISTLKYILNHPNSQVVDIDILSKSEKETLLYKFNDTDDEYSKNKTIQDLFINKVKVIPHHICAVYENKYLTYSQLDKLTTILGIILRKYGIKQDVVVGLIAERSLEMLMGILGILKAGGAYIPIDPSFPLERIKYMLNDSGTTRIVTNHPKLHLDSSKYSIIDLQGIDKNPPAAINLININKAHDIAYLIYTSGSTGKPKGVLIHHQAVHNFINGITQKIKFDPTRTIIALTTISFDIFFLETILALAKGLKVIIAKQDIQKNPGLLNDLIIKHNIDMMQITPVGMQILTESTNNPLCFKYLKDIMVGGEAFPLELLNKLKSLTTAKIYNMYGPTETTIWSSFINLDNQGNIYIGQPISNTYIYILNKNNKLQPLGAAGELYIVGDSLAKGYVNQVELTHKKFIDNPFNLHKKMYRTGDLARWLPNGVLEFIGRNDNQVKISGYRIELGEIEKRINQHMNIKESVVMVKNSDLDKFLCAFIVVKQKMKDSEIRHYLQKHLPFYMIPHQFIFLDKMPLTHNKKIDRNSLKKIEIKFAAKITRPPNNDELKLIDIFCDILKIHKKKIDIESNFFQLGGQSLKLIRLQVQVHKIFNAKLPIQQLIDHPTISQIAGLIQDHNYSHFITIPAAEKKEFYDLSPMQKAIYTLYKINPGNLSYNMPVMLTMEGRLDIKAVEKAIQRLIRRHEGLRTSFHIIGNKSKQIIHKNAKFNLEVIRLEPDEFDGYGEDLPAPFNLNKAPLIKAQLIVLNENKFILFVDIHHIISDGFSQALLIKEFMSCYQNKQLNPLKIQFKDYSEWINNKEYNQLIREQEQFWINEFQGEIPLLNLPANFKRPPSKTFAGDIVKFALDKDDCMALNKLARQEKTTLFVLLLAIFYILLSKISGQNKIIIGVPTAARTNHEIENILGPLVNTLPIPGIIDNEICFISFLNEVHNKTMLALENQDVRNEDLIEKLPYTYYPNRNPLFDVSFVFQNIDYPAFELPGLDVTYNEIINKAAKFDMDWIGKAADDSVEFNIRYKTKLFKESTIINFTEKYRQIISAVINDNNIKLYEITTTSDSGQQNFLTNFNEDLEVY